MGLKGNASTNEASHERKVSSELFNFRTGNVNCEKTLNLHRVCQVKRADFFLDFRSQFAVLVQTFLGALAEICRD